MEKDVFRHYASESPNKDKTCGYLTNHQGIEKATMRVLFHTCSVQACYIVTAYTDQDPDGQVGLRTPQVMYIILLSKMGEEAGNRGVTSLSVLYPSRPSNQQDSYNI